MSIKISSEENTVVQLLVTLPILAIHQIYKNSSVFQSGCEVTSWCETYFCFMRKWHLICYEGDKKVISTWPALHLFMVENMEMGLFLQFLLLNVYSCVFQTESLQLPFFQWKTLLLGWSVTGRSRGCCNYWNKQCFCSRNIWRGTSGQQ